MCVCMQVCDAHRNVGACMAVRVCMCAYACVGVCVVVGDTHWARRADTHVTLLSGLTEGQQVPNILLTGA